MAYADAVKAGVGIDPDKRAYHMFIRSGLTDDQIHDSYGSCTIPKWSDHRQLWILARFTTNLGMWTDTVTPERLWADIRDLWWDLLQRPRTDVRRRIILGPGLAASAATRKSPGEERSLQQKDGYEYNDSDDSSSTWQQYTAEKANHWEEDADLETYLAGETVWIHRDSLDSDTLDSYVEQECSADQSLYEAFWEVQRGSRCAESTAARTWFLARECDSCLRWPFSDVGAVMTHYVGAREKTAKARPTKARGAKEAKVESRCVAWGVETWTAPSTNTAETGNMSWTSQVQESTNLMGVTMTMPGGHAIWGLRCCA